MLSKFIAKLKHGRFIYDYENLYYWYSLLDPRIQQFVKVLVKDKNRAHAIPDDMELDLNNFVIDEDGCRLDEDLYRSIMKYKRRFRVIFE